MNRFIIHNGLPFLHADGKAYAVRWDDKGFTVGAEVELTSVPETDLSEISVKAKCAVWDSITATETDSSTEGFDGMTVAELKKYATDHGIDLKATKKADIIDEIANTLI